MKIFDIHVHIFPDNVAAKAVAGIGGFYEGFPMECDGRLDTAVQLMDAAGIARCAAHSVATTPHQVHSINEFILAAAREYPERIVPFAALHPGLANAPGTAQALKVLGFKGVKLHPEIQRFNIDDPAVLDMLAPLEAVLPVLVHCGDYRYDNSCPARIKHVLREFPRMTLICAHLGGWQVWRENAAALAGADVYVDTSSALFALKPGEAERIIRDYGVDRALYGTDFPMWSPVGEVARFNRLDLTDDEREKILWTNHLKLFPLCGE